VRGLLFKIARRIIGKEKGNFGPAEKRLARNGIPRAQRLLNQL
jgi:hypothetical protein